MAGFYSTYKVFTPGEILTASDLNASEQQHVTFQQATVTEGYSRTLGESRIQASSASLATTVADEISRIREKLRLLGNVQYWDQVVGPAANPAMPKAQVLLPLEGATPADGTNVPAGLLGNGTPGLFVRKSAATPPLIAPAIIETVYEFGPSGGQSLMWKITTPLGFAAGGTAEVVLKFSVKENKGGNVRWLATLSPIWDESSHVGFAVAPASMWGPDNIPVPTWGAQKEVRISVPTYNVGENTKCFVIITGWAATTNNCESPLFLESATIEFTRGNFVVQNPGMPNPMIEQGDIIIGWTSGSPIRLDGGLDSQVLTMIGGLPSWQNPPAGMQNPMVANADLIVGGLSGVPSRFPVGANGQILAVAGGGLTWQNPTTTTRPNVDYIDFTAGTLLPLPPVGHVYLGVEPSGGVPNLTLRGPAGGAMRIAGLGGPYVGLQFFDEIGPDPIMEFVANSSTDDLWIGSNRLQRTHLYTGSPNPPYYIENITIRPDGHTEFGEGCLYLSQLPTAPGGETPFTALYARNDRRLYYTDETDVERPVDPITTRGDIVIGDAAGVATRLPLGTSGKILTVSGLDVVWGDPVAAGNPLTATGDMIYASAGGIQQRLPVGATGRVLTVLGGLPSWEVSPGITNPMTQLGDIIYGGTSGTPTRLAVGAENRVLTISGGLPTWQVPSGGLTNPMTSIGDMIRGGTAGDPTRLAPGTNGHFLSLVGGIPTWAAAPGFANPMTTAGDIIIGAASGVAQRTGIGTAGHVLTVVGTTPTWAAPSGGMTNPMTAPADLIVGGASGTPTRLAVGTNTHVLTIVGGALAWQAPVSGGMTNPMTTLGDIITGAASGVAQRLGVGSNTQVLTIVGGVPTWAAPVSGGMTNPMTTVGDIIIGGASGAANRLAASTNGFVLTLTAGSPAWAANAAMTNPMTTPGDMIRATTAGAAQRFAVGSNGQVLTVVAGVPGWAADVGFANPMTTLGDIMTGGASGAPGRLGIGTTNQILTVVGGVPAWATPSGLSNPMTTAEDIIKGGASGTPVRLARGSNNQYLGVSSNIVQWITPSFITNPMTSTGDVIVGGASGAPARLGIGSTNQVLTVIAGTPSWVTPTALTNPMTTVGDLIVGGASGSPTRLAAVATGQVLSSAGTSTAPTWNASPTLTGLSLSGLTSGSVVFAGASGVLSQDNANLFWDDTNNNLRLFGGTVGTSGQKVLALFAAGAAPTTFPVDVVQLYAGDVVGAGTMGLWVLDEQGGSVKLSARRLALEGGSATDASLYLAPTGGHVIEFFSGGTGSAVGAGTSAIKDLTTGLHLLLWTPTNQTYMVVQGTAHRHVSQGAIDSGGSGYRQLLIAN